MSEEVRIMGFNEIGQGALGKDVQRVFEQAQAISFIRGVQTKLTLQITINPPAEDADGQFYGSISYQTKLKEPPKLSRAFETVVDDGISVRGAEVPMEQLDLLKKPALENLTEFNQKQS